MKKYAFYCILFVSFEKNYKIFGFQSAEIMQFKSILLLLLFMVIFVQTLRGQTCDCTFCSDRVTVSAYGENRIYNPIPCPAGKAAAVSTINVQSTDGSGFQIFTMDDPTGTTYYTAGSTTTTVTCFKMGSGVVVGGQKSQIYVVIKCRNSLNSCSLKYSIDLICASVTTTSTPKLTSASTAKPVQPSTVAPIGGGNTCECHCCKGSATCTSVLVGAILYNSNTCEVSNCARRCPTLFSACPTGGNQLGKIKTYCKTNTGITKKNVFYITLLSLFILNII